MLVSDSLGRGRWLVQDEDVLILVLVDVGLGLPYSLFLIPLERAVLILVLVDVGLGRSDIGSCSVNLLS